MAGSSKRLRLNVYKARGEMVVWIIITIIVVFSTLVGISNFFYRIALIPSTLWIVFVAFLVVSHCREHGSHRFVQDMLEDFSRRHFVEIGESATGASLLRVCFSLFGKDFVCAAIPLTSISEVHWSPGQASSLAGRDVGDWSVSVWYDAEDSDARRRRSRGLRQDRDIVALGSPRPKEITAAFGRELLALLADAGTVLVPGKDECTFVRRPSAATSGETTPPSATSTPDCGGPTGTPTQ